MSNPIINIPADPVIMAAEKLNECGARIAAVLAEQLTRAVQAVAPINNIFWSDPRVGIGGAALLAKLGAHVQLLATHYPGYINSVLSGAGQYLTPQPDGSVVYAPPPPESEPEGGE